MHARPSTHDAPNVVFIICDDLCYGDLSCLGNPHAATPCLDTLFAQSTRLSRYRSGPLCSPARASVMTGRYHYRTGVVDTYLGRSVMHPDEVALPKVLGDAGYSTGLFGKWHLGDAYPSRPQDFGFDEVLCHASGGIGQPGDHPLNAGRDSYFDPVLWHNGRPRQYDGYCTDIFFDAACRWIEKRNEASEPFFAYVAANCPHSPFQVPEELVAPFRDKLPETWAQVAGMIKSIDENVGKLMALLGRLGIEKNTLLVFTSDHGPCNSARVDGKDRFNTGLRGNKGTMYDGGLRVPCFWRWPAMLPQGRNIARNTHPIDILPTLAAICKASPPSDRTIDGRNLLPLMSGQISHDDWPARTLFTQWHRGDTPQPRRNCAAFNDRFKWCINEGASRPELFDIRADRNEEHSVMTDHMHVGNELAAEYDAWFADVSTERGEDTFAPVRPHVGSEKENPILLTRQDWRIYGTTEDWSVENPGRWFVTIERGGAYDLSVGLPPRDEAMVLHVKCGSTHEARQIDPITPGVSLTDVSLDAGDFEFEAYLEKRDGSKLGVEHVDLSHHDLADTR